MALYVSLEGVHALRIGRPGGLVTTMLPPSMASWRNSAVLPVPLRPRMSGRSGRMAWYTVSVRRKVSWKSSSDWASAVPVDIRSPASAAAFVLVGSAGAAATTR
jgi:hypothetical protein